MKIDLTEGNIFKKITILALPIMGTSLIQSAYSMTDMIWVGRLGSRAVTAVGTAGFFTWFAFAFITIPQIGAAVGVSQSVGRKDVKETKNYIRHSLQMNLVFAILYGVTMIIFRKQLIGFFNIKGDDIVSMASNFLAIVSSGMIFFFLPPVFTAIFNGHGDSRTPFRINIIGLMINIILDPFLILGLGPFPRMGVPGAAISTIFAQFVVTIIFIFVITKKTDYFDQLNFLQKPDWDHMIKILKFGMPVAVQSVGSQIESITWMTAGGFQTALSAFIGQNFGAKKWDRIYKGYFTAISIITVFGTITSFFLIFFPGPIFSIFISEKAVIKDGIVYLRILGVSQIFMCIEMTTAGAFNGLGRTVPPSIVGIVLNALRIPGALLLSTVLGLSGVWWSISISSILKGIILTSWFIIFIGRHPEIRRHHEIRRKELLSLK